MTTPRTRDSPKHGESTVNWELVPVPSREHDIQLAKDATLRFQHRLLAYTGELSDSVLTEKWSDYSGQQYAWTQWQIAQAEGRAAEFLTPQAAVEAMTLQDGFSANVYAAEPTITQPMAFCWDDRGRMWIAENRDYETRRTGFANSGDSRILILEDTDRDGVVDSKKVFLEGIPFPAAIAVGHEGLWLGAPRIFCLFQTATRMIEPTWTISKCV